MLGSPACAGDIAQSRRTPHHSRFPVGERARDARASSDIANDPFQRIDRMAHRRRFRAWIFTAVVSRVRFVHKAACALRYIDFLVGGESYRSRLIPTLNKLPPEQSVATGQSQSGRASY